MAANIALTIPNSPRPGFPGAQLTSGAQAVDTSETTLTIANNDNQPRWILLQMVGATPPEWQYNYAATQGAGLGTRVTAKSPATILVPEKSTATLYLTLISGAGFLNAQVAM